VVPVGGHRWNTEGDLFAEQREARMRQRDRRRRWYFSGDRITYRLNLNFVCATRCCSNRTHAQRGHCRAMASTDERPSTRGSVTRSPDLFVKGFFQYNDDRKQASFNALLWYIFRPGSDLYVVYNQGMGDRPAGPQVVSPAQSR
jgi:hypothetical protein